MSILPRTVARSFLILAVMSCYACGRKETTLHHPFRSEYGQMARPLFEMVKMLDAQDTDGAKRIVKNSVLKKDPNIRQLMERNNYILAREYAESSLMFWMICEADITDVIPVAYEETISFLSKIAQYPHWELTQDRDEILEIALELQGKKNLWVNNPKKLIDLRDKLVERNRPTLHSTEALKNQETAAEKK